MNYHMPDTQYDVNIAKKIASIELHLFTILILIQKNKNNNSRKQLLRV